MTDAAARAVKQWHALVVPPGWHVQYHYHRDAWTLDDDQFETLAQCRTRWAYKKAIVEFSLPACAELDAEDLERTVIHELLHIVVNEMRECADSERLTHEERVVSELTDMVVRLVGGL
jgi:hypothetical protein